MSAPPVAKLRVGILASGGGTATEALLRATAPPGVATGGNLAAEVVLILTDRAGAPVLGRAARHGIPASFIDPSGHTRAAYDEAITERLREAGVQLVLMAGYRRIVSASFVQAWRGLLLNVHPSLLPAFAGMMDMRVHEAVLASGATETGCTVHHVTEEVDAGEILLQKRCAVLPIDTATTLRTRVQALENDAFVEVVRAWVPSEATAEAGNPAVQVGIIMGSRSDWPTMQAAAEAMDNLGIPYEVAVVSAHRTPGKMFAYARGAQARGLQVLIAGAGGAAHLPGMVASLTVLPVLGVPVQSKALNGLDSLLSIVQMPGGIPVATFAIGVAGAKNAGLFAASLLALGNPELAGRLAAFRQQQTEEVLRVPDPRV